MTILAALLGAFLVLSTLWEGFETIVLPRSVNRPIRLTRQFYQLGWPLWRHWGMRRPPGSSRQQWMGIFGPLSLPLLLSLWAVLLIIGFALLQWSLGNALAAPEKHPGFGTDFYQSGATFFTLGYGDVVPRTAVSRTIAILECGVGFGFLALVIGYLPVLYQAFSRREATISRLDARASSPATAVEMLRRYGSANAMTGLEAYLRDWEQWASEILESHLSYPVLAYYRSQHEHQSWLSALQTIMDACTLLIIGMEDADRVESSLTWQARLTWAMARHTVIDLAYTFNARPVDPDPDRLPPEALAQMRTDMAAAGFPLRSGPEDDAKLRKMRGLYEPYFCALADYLAFPLPAWTAPEATTDNWQNSAWDHDQPHF